MIVLTIRVYAQNHSYAIFYAIRQLAYTPWLYAIFGTCAQVTTISWHSHIEFKPSQLLQFNTNWRLYESGVNLNQRLAIKFYDYKSYALTICIYRVYTYELSSNLIHLFIFNQLDVKTVQRHQQVAIIAASTRIWSSDAHAHFSLIGHIFVKSLYDDFYD